MRNFLFAVVKLHTIVSLPTIVHNVRPVMLCALAR